MNQLIGRGPVAQAGRPPPFGRSPGPPLPRLGTTPPPRGGRDLRRPANQRTSARYRSDARVREEPVSVGLLIGRVSTARFDRMRRERARSPLAAGSSAASPDSAPASRPYSGLFGVSTAHLAPRTSEGRSRTHLRPMPVSVGASPAISVNLGQSRSISGESPWTRRSPSASITHGSEARTSGRGGRVGCGSG